LRRRSLSNTIFFRANTRMLYFCTAFLSVTFMHPGIAIGPANRMRNVRAGIIRPAASYADPPMNNLCALLFSVALVEISGFYSCPGLDSFTTAVDSADV